MGFNTAVIILNDSVHMADENPHVGTDLYHAVCNARADDKFSGAIAVQKNRGVATLGYALPSQHADTIQIVAVGGNQIRTLGFSYSNDDEVILRTLADKLGFRLVKKKQK